MKKIKYILIILAVAMSVSCNKFLDIHPDGEKLEKDIFDTAEGFENALYGVYATLNSDDLYGKSCSFYLNDVIGQYFSNDGISQTHIVYKMSQFEYKDALVRPLIDAIWNKMYENIGYVNNVIGNLDSKEEAKNYPLYNLYYAESLALRAFMHFELTRYFSENILLNSNAVGIPYREKYDFTVNDFEPLSKTYEKIIRDLKRAEELFGDKEYFNIENNDTPFLNDRNTHINLHAVRAMLARVYWSMGELKNASDYALKVINSNEFEFVASTELGHFLQGRLSERETIWGLYSNTYSRVVGDYLYRIGNGGIGMEVKPYEDRYQADKEGVDYRYEEWFSYIQTANWSADRCLKTYDSDDYYSIENGYDPEDGINLIRLPEMYYIVAEYYVSVGDNGNAIKYFDEVIAARGLTKYSERSNSTISVDIINNERCKEYIAEGQYFFVLKKYNMDVYESKSTKTFPASNDIYVLPIPADEVDYRD